MKCDTCHYEESNTCTLHGISCNELKDCEFHEFKRGMTFQQKIRDRTVRRIKQNER